MEAHISEHRSTKLPDPLPSKRQRISEFLGQLKAIEKRLNDLKSSTSSRLASMGSPSPCRIGCPIAEYPRHCTHKRFANSPSCGTGLTRPRIVEDVEILTPIKPFLSFDFKDWLAGLVSWPGYEDLMDSAWKKTNADPANGISDITEADFLRNFLGPDGERLFQDGRSEGRYAFSLCVDFFNPLSNKQAGKKVSIGIISLACLNLPLDECYKPENMFLVGIIPGPKEPPLNLLNHYLTPIVDDLLELWSPGV